MVDLATIGKPITFFSLILRLIFCWLNIISLGSQINRLMNRFGFLDHVKESYNRLKYVNQIESKDIWPFKYNIHEGPAADILISEDVIYRLDLRFLGFDVAISSNNISMLLKKMTDVKIRNERSRTIAQWTNYTKKKWIISVTLTGVPLTTVDTWSGILPSVSGSGASRESPKSATLAVNLWSNKMLLALISRWNIGGSASVWR